MKKLILPVLLLIVSAAPAAATQKFEGTIVLGAPDGGSATYFIKGDEIRMEISGEEPVVLRNVRESSVRVLFPRQRIYSVAPMIDMRQYAEPGAPPKVTKTGQTQMMHGYRTEKWTFPAEDGQVELWVTSQLGLSFDVLLNPMMRMPHEWKQVLGAYFPLKVLVIERGSKPETFMEVRSIERKPLESALFTIPAGFRKQ